MITCHSCTSDKKDRDFSWSKKDVKRHTVCKACCKSYANKYYKKNKQSYLNRNKIRRTYVKKLIIIYLLEHPCCDCGEKDPACLDFDHRERSKKEGLITRMATDGIKWDRIKKEIEKCDVRCASCHRKKTRREEKWYERHADVLNGGDKGFGGINARCSTN